MVFRPILACFAALLLLAACAGVNREEKFPDKDRESRYAYGSAVSEKGGFSLFGDRDDERKKRQATGIGVNGFLWRAALDTIAFMPIASADPFGGTVITDWYSTPAAPNERVKLNVFVLSRDLRADGVKVSVFRQVKEKSGNWADATAAADTASKLEDSILTRARQLRVKSLEDEKRG
ncbi:MAG: DUF3576 domain-containing protein [Proteobacteria bacterium]|nr:DUF3576 domain-containing protein [Pseudomonadota bacterium]